MAAYIRNIVFNFPVPVGGMVIQDIMDHADIQTTMDIYAEAAEEKKQEVVNSLQGKIILK